MATHSSSLAWKIPWMEEPGKLQCVGSQRAGHDFSFTFPFSALKLEWSACSLTLQGQDETLDHCLQSPAWSAFISQLQSSVISSLGLLLSFPPVDTYLCFSPLHFIVNTINLSSVQIVLGIVFFFLPPRLGKVIIMKQQILI